MFRNRKHQETLPMSGNVAPSSFHFPTGNGKSSYASMGSDGSGKAIRMEAPIARAWKKASGYTKGSYYALITCFLMTYFGYRWLRWNHASVHLTCHSEECTFWITPQGWNGSHKATFPRHQLVSAEAMKVTKEGEFVEMSPRLDNFQDIPGKGKNKNKKKTSSYKGPDKNGHYPSYRVTLRVASEEQQQQQTGDSTPGDAEEILSNEIPSSPLTTIERFMEKGSEENTLTIIIRKFNIGQSRRRVKTTVQKIDSYIKRRRHKLTIKENVPPAWQGILLLVVGIFGLLLTVLIGQFWDDDSSHLPKKRQSGPGTRTRKTPDYKGKRPSVASSVNRGASAVNRGGGRSKAY
ncbi:expressed unknown protein [Seminavis robusta]|uniref:Uncharacterized protein n=1 Tax=Seminavis robusta TaxID=568900 RepID=A0A9N8DAX8_9STRA|nr:expressed unknown protein [Seminavis robusta]|eukprot:Sro66_g037030.1 n/a (349) ;mRNA; f:4108-5272